MICQSEFCKTAAPLTTGPKRWRCPDWNTPFLLNSIPKSHQERDTSTGSICTNVNRNAHKKKWLIGEAQGPGRDCNTVSNFGNPWWFVSPLSMPMEIMKVNTRCTNASWQFWPLKERTWIYRWQDSLEAHRTTVSCWLPGSLRFTEYPSPCSNISTPTRREVLLTNIPVGNCYQ